MSLCSALPPLGPGWLDGGRSTVGPGERTRPEEQTPPRKALTSLIRLPNIRNLKAST